MRIKICGLTREEDAALAAHLGAWMLGFIFYPPSPRYIAPAAVKSILNGIQTPAAGVFVNQVESVIPVVAEAGLKAVQLHGDETPEDCRRLKDSFDGILIKALRPKNEKDLAQIDAYKNHVDYILLDTALEGQYGGTGKVADWSLAARAAGNTPVILAGGLKADNILDAALQVRPYALDLSSGVEARPGVKDAGKLKNLFTAIQGD